MRWGKSEESESRVTDARELKQGRNRSLDTALNTTLLDRLEVVTVGGMNDGGSKN